MVVAEAGVLEDSRGVEGDDVDTAHLLTDHDDEGSERGSANTGDSEQLDETGHVVALSNDITLDFQLRVDIVEVGSSLDWVVSKLEERFERLCVSILLW